MLERLLLCVLLTSLAHAAQPSGASKQVKRGPFRKTVVLDGDLSARTAEKIFTPVVDGWRVQIKAMVEEGTTVKPGDVVVRFDTSGIAKRIETLQSDLKLAYAERENKKLEMKNSARENEFKVTTARLNLDKAELDIRPPKELFAARDYQKMVLERDRAKQRLEVEEQSRIKSEKDQGDQLFLMNIKVEALERELVRKRRALTELEPKAKTGGVVIYSNYGWESRKVEVGDTMQSTWDVMEITDLRSLEASTYVSETDLTHVVVGQAAELVLDAYPDRTYKGRVVEIGSRGETRDQWGTAAWFKVRVAFEQPDIARMRPGMSIRTTLLVKDVAAALLVPLEYVDFAEGRFTVTPKGAKPLAVETLGTNPFFLAVPLDGPLKEGMVLQ